MVNVMQYNIDSIIRSKPAWIFYLLLIQALIVIMAIKGMQFVLKKESSIFAWKIKDRPKHWKTYDLIAKVIVTAGLAFLVITYTLPFLSRSCYTSIERLGNPRHLCQNRHNKRY